MFFPRNSTGQELWVLLHLCTYPALPQLKCNVLHLALWNLIKFLSAHFSSLSRSVWMVSLYCVFYCVSGTTQLAGICKLAEAALNPIIYVSDKCVKEYWSQNRALWDATHHQPPFGHKTMEHNPQAATTQPILYPPSSLQIHISPV